MNHFKSLTLDEVCDILVEKKSPNDTLKILDGFISPISAAVYTRALECEMDFVGFVPSSV